MNPDQPRTRPPRAGTNAQAFNTLLEQIRNLVQSARKTAVTAINSLQVITSFEIGRMIVEHEQQGVQSVAAFLVQICRICVCFFWPIVIVCRKNARCHLAN
jgi:hypothetical protein